MHPSPPPFQPHQAPVVTPPASPAGTTGLRLGLVALAIIVTAVLVFVGFAVGVLWAFAACYKATCSETDAAAIVLLPAFGLVLGIGIAALLRRQRRWFYANPIGVWLPLGLVVTMALAIVALLGG